MERAGLSRRSMSTACARVMRSRFSPVLKTPIRPARKDRRARSCRVRIIPREVLERLVRAHEGMEVLAAKYREAERRLEALADEIERLRADLEKLPPGSTLASATQNKLQELARRFRDDTAAIRESRGTRCHSTSTRTCRASWRRWRSRSTR